MSERRWFNSSQPQTLQLAQMLLYLGGGLGLLVAVITGGLGRLGIIISIGEIVAAFGIANEKKWGYWVGVVFAFLPFVLIAYFLVHYHVLAIGLFSLVIDVVLVIALFHPMTREYKRIWFR